MDGFEEAPGWVGLNGRFNRRDHAATAKIELSSKLTGFLRQPLVSVASCSSRWKVIGRPLRLTICYSLELGSVMQGLS